MGKVEESWSCAAVELGSGWRQDKALETVMRVRDREARETGRKRVSWFRVKEQRQILCTRLSQPV